MNLNQYSLSLLTQSILIIINNLENKMHKFYYLKFIFFLVFILLYSIDVKAQWVVSYGTSAYHWTAYTVNGGNIFAGTSSGAVYSSSDGVNWQGLYNFSGSNGINCMTTRTTLTSNNIYVGTESKGIYKSSNGVDWFQANNGLSNFRVTALASSGNNLYAGTSYNGIHDGSLFISTDGGSVWSESNAGLIGPNGESLARVNSIAVQGVFIYAATDCGIFLSINNGASWSSINNGLTDEVYSLAYSGLNTFAGTLNGKVFISTDYGASWSERDNGINTTTNQIFSIFTSIDTLYAATYDGVYASTNNGLSWTLNNEGQTSFPSFWVWANNSKVITGTSGGIWNSTVSYVTPVEKSLDNLPSYFSIAQNFPNPFNPSTIIKYDIPKESFVTIIVYDALGREVIELVNKQKSAGSYQETFNAAKLASGIYFYRIQAGSFVETKKMILMR